MKKLALILAIAMIASFSAVPAMADLDIGGSYRAVATSNDLGYIGAGIDPPNETWVDQRMRVAFNWGVNDNVAVQLRGDFAEMTWGDAYRPTAGSSDTLMIDRAFVTIKQGPLTLTVGQQAQAWGQGLLWSDQFQGIHADLDFAPFNVKALWSKESESLTVAVAPAPPTTPFGSTGDAKTDNANTDDTDIYGLQLGYSADTFTAALTYVTMSDDAFNWAAAPGADSVTLSGYSGTVTAAIGDVSLGAELAIFDGDNGLNGATKIDYEGTQLVAFARTAFTEQFKVGVTVLWADDVDNSTPTTPTTKQQKTVIVDDTGFNPFDYAGALGYDNGVRFMPAVNTPTSLFDIAQSNAGVMGLILDASFAATESITFYGKLMYAEPSDDVAVNVTPALANPGLDNAFGAIANVDYAWMPAVTLSAGMMYIAPDFDATDAQLTAMGITDDAALQMVVRLGVTF